MRQSAFHILRVGTAITFLWIGVLIFKEPEAWGGLLQPWVFPLIMVSLKQAMIGTALLDIIIGGLLLVDKFTWLASLAGALHLIVVLVATGITTVTVRDIGLLAATIALITTAWSKK